MAQTLALPKELTKRGEVLLNQQCWCWGKDIVRPEGNLLPEYGFERECPPEGKKGATRYSRRLPSGEMLHLWGFGFWVGCPQHGAIYLNRFVFVPQTTPRKEIRTPVWEASQLCAKPLLSVKERAAMHWLLPLALREISDYERWVLKTFGKEYRHEIVQHLNKSPLDVSVIPDLWDALACDCELALLEMAAR